MLISRRKCVSRSSCSTLSVIGGVPAPTSSRVISSGCSTAPVGQLQRTVASLPREREPGAGEHPPCLRPVAAVHDQPPALVARELLRAELLQQAPAVKDADPGRQAGDLAEDVARHEHRDAPLLRERA
jgi:hypothetical protein